MSRLKRTPSLSLLSLCILSSGLVSGLAQAADSKSTASGKAAAPKTNTLETVGDEAERVNIEAIKQKYWARGNEEELGVVQNRMFTKERKFEFGLYGGVVSSDPFLSVYSTSLSIGYHFNEYFSFAVYAMKNFVNPSSALTFLRNPYPNGAGSDTSTNEPRWCLGGEVMASIMYGKLSLVGKAIIHYDFHFIGGLGITDTESGKYATPWLGVGQQFFITRWMTLRFDYRLMFYEERILQKVGSPSSPNGTYLGNRANWSNSINLGLSFLWGPSAKKASAEDTELNKK
jgi:outer membrane beta-barrel protein